MWLWKGGSSTFTHTAIFLPLVAGVFWLQCLVARMPDSPHLLFLSPVSNKHPFVDSNLLYQFRMNFRRRRRLMELLNEKSPSQETHDSPFCLRKQSHDNRKSTSFMSGRSVPQSIWSHAFGFWPIVQQELPFVKFCSLANFYLFITKKYAKEIKKHTQPDCSQGVKLEIRKSIIKLCIWIIEDFPSLSPTLLIYFSFINNCYH